MQMNTIFSALAGAERVFQVMDEAPETADAADAVVLNPCKGHVELKDVTFGYVPGHTILKHISLYAKPGQKIAFVGSTGAGQDDDHEPDQPVLRDRQRRNPDGWRGYPQGWTGKPAQ